MRARVLAGVGVAVVAGVLVASRELADGPTPPRLETAYFTLAPGLDRARRTVDVMVNADTCVPQREAPASRYQRANVTVERHAYVVTVLLRAERGCAGVALPPFRRRLTLPAAVGRRAIVNSCACGNWERILLPPRGRTAVRALVARRDRAYVGPACDDAARYLRDRPRRDWCFH
jgi:hypothetical protein